MRNLLLAGLLLALSHAVFAETTAITNAKIHTVGSQGTLDDATVVFADGKIVAVGTDVDVPAGAAVIDAAGKIVTPGLFTPAGGLGLVEVGLSAGPIDAEQRGTQFTASFDVASAFNRRSTLIAINRTEGVTRSLIAPKPGSVNEAGETGHLFSGLAAVVNLGDGNSIDKRAAALVVNLGETGSVIAGGSRAAATMMLRNALDEASDYASNKAAYERGQRRPYSLSTPDLEALQSVLSGDVPLLASVDRASDISAFIGLVKEYDVRAIVSGGAESWMVADELAAAGVGVIIAPTLNLPGNFDRINARLGTATILADAGVAVTFAESQSTTHNARNITQSAGNAVVDGLSWDAALRAITLTPAEMFGVADVTGSIEAGKQADLVIWPADPLELTSFPEQVFIKGEAVSMTNRQTLLRDRYRRPKQDRPPAFRN
ncbi:MAG: amidohydrolase family protein [Woeseiaceae bacterium]|nr:amidohydrolase family protein [Woeseiaceae bacterium]